MSRSTYEQQVTTAEDTDAIRTRITEIQGRIDKAETACEAGAEQIKTKRGRSNAVEEHDRGWSVIVVLLFAVLAICFEIVPAHMMSLVFFAASPTELILLTAAFAGFGALIGLITGELLRRYRKPQPHTFIDRLLLALAVGSALAFHAFGFALRLAYANATPPDGVAQAISPTLQASMLTTLAVVGTILALVSGYHREAFDTMKVRESLARLQNEVRVNELHLKVLKQERERAKRALEAAEAPTATPATAQAAADQPTVTPPEPPPATAKRTGAGDDNGVVQTTRYDG